MVKSIIKRIIVGVGVALVLMSLSKHGLIANAYALSCDTDANSSIHPITSSGNLSYQISGGGSAPQWSGFDLSTPYRVNFPSGYDFIDIKIPVSWSIATTTGNVSPQLNTVDFSGVFFYLRLKNSRNSTGDYRGYYKDNYLYVRIYKTAVGDYFDIMNFRVAVPSINYTDQVIRVWLYYTDWWQVEHYKCDSNAALQQSIEENTQAVEDVNNSINDNSTDDPSSDISTMNGKLASNNSITQLLTLPIQMYQNILNAVSGSCSSFSLGSLYNHNLTLPCINLENLLGSTLYGIIDILISGLFILSFRKKMVDIFNNMTSLKDRGNELE